MVSKALVVGAYQRKLEELARLPSVRLTAVVPPFWREGSGPVPLERAHTQGYTLVQSPAALNGRFHLHYYPELPRLLAEHRPDLLHMDEEPYNFATWHALREAERAGVRAIFFSWQNLPRAYPMPFRFFERANYRRAAYAIAGNQDAADVLRAKGYRGPLAVIPQFGIDPELFCPGSEPARDGILRIGYSGRLVPEKGIDVLLRACALLPAGRWRLELVGDGAARPQFEAQAQALGISDRVAFAGRVPSTRTPEAYRGFDVLVLPSVSRPNWVEQFGRVLVEAMACGTPVIGSDSGEIPRVIGDAGLVFPEGDAGALAAALTLLMDDPARRRALAARGRERALQHFTQSCIAAETYRVYAAVLGQQPAAVARAAVL